MADTLTIDNKASVASISKHVRALWPDISAMDNLEQAMRSAADTLRQALQTIRPLPEFRSRFKHEQIHAALDALEQLAAFPAAIRKLHTPNGETSLSTKEVQALYAPHRHLKVAIAAVERFGAERSYNIAAMHTAQERFINEEVKMEAPRMRKLLAIFTQREGILFSDALFAR